jgi:uncharacterized iron-regulated protein
MRQSYLSNIAYKLVRSRGSPILFPDHFKNTIAPDDSQEVLPSTSNNNSNFGQSSSNNEMIQEIVQNNRLIFFGEIHSVPSIVAFQCELLKEMACTSNNVIVNQHSTEEADEELVVDNPNIKDDEIYTTENITKIVATQHSHSTVHVIMEHFSFEMQDLLDDYIRNDVIYTFEEFKQKYREIGNEGHDLEPYRPLLDFAKDNPDTVMVHAGFIPREYARLLMKEGQLIALETAARFLPKDSSSNIDILKGSEFHFKVFSSLLSGKPIDVPVSESHEPTSADDRNLNPETSDSRQQFRRAIFVAQLLKDVAMSNKVNTIIDQYGNDKFLVIAGYGHMLHYCGVPERVLTVNQEMSSQSCLIVSASCDSSDGLLSESIETNGDKTSSPYARINQYLTSIFGPKGSYPSDYVYLYENQEELEEESEEKNHPT